MIFLSVIIAAHNAEKELNLTLQSLFLAIGNALNEIKVVIINDNSIDSTQDIISFWKNKFLHFATKQVQYSNIGQVRNNALSLVSGEYVMMLDNGDQLKHKSLEDAITFLKKQKPDMLLTRLIEVRNKKQISNLWNGFNPLSLTKEKVIKYFLLHKDLQAHLIGQFIHRNLYINNPIPSFICYEDFAIFPSLLLQSEKIFFQRHGHYFYVKKQNSLSSNLTKKKFHIL